MGVIIDSKSVGDTNKFSLFSLFRVGKISCAMQYNMEAWKRYVDDSFCIIKRNAVDSFHNTLNSIDQHISFTIEEENNNQIAFLDALVSP